MSDNWDISPGDVVRRVELHDQFGGGRQGGISPSRRSSNILIFSDPDVGEQHGYQDEWVDGDYHYVGEGQVGDQTMDRGNGAILRHEDDGRALRLFWGVRGMVQYAGEFDLAQPDPWYTRTAKETGSDRQRTVIVFRLRPQGTTTPGTERGREARRIVQPRRQLLSTPYRPANEDVASAPRDPFEVDPVAVDRGLIGHARTQNVLADLVKRAGLAPLSPGDADPDFDLAWEVPGGCVVVEVKSLTGTNQDRQLRLGLGQVLDYRHQLLITRHEVTAVLAVESEPADARWIKVCAENGVTLTWPGRFGELVIAG